MDPEAKSFFVFTNDGNKVLCQQCYNDLKQAIEEELQKTIQEKITSDRIKGKMTL